MGAVWSGYDRLSYGLGEWTLNTNSRDWSAPATVLLDRWYGVIPATLGVFLSLSACMAIYRWIVRLGCPRGFRRQRVASVSLYMSALAIAEVALLGGVLNLLLILTINEWRLRAWTKWFVGPVIGLGVVMAAVYFVSTMGFVWGRGRWKAWRTTLLLLFPLVALFLGYFIDFWVHWVIGLLVVAARSAVG